MMMIWLPWSPWFRGFNAIQSIFDTKSFLQDCIFFYAQYLCKSRNIPVCKAKCHGHLSGMKVKNLTQKDKKKMKSR